MERDGDADALGDSDGDCDSLEDCVWSGEGDVVAMGVGNPKRVGLI